MTKNNELNTTQQDYSDKDVEELYQHYRNNPQDLDLIEIFDRIDTNSVEYKAYEKRRDGYWDRIIEKATLNVKQTTSSRKMELTKWSSYFMLAGILFGFLLHFLFEETTGALSEYMSFKDSILYIFQKFGDFFINLLKYAAIPLVIVSIIEGIISVEKSNALWRISRKSIFLYLITTLIATTLALLVATFIGLGLGHSSDDYTTEDKASVETIINGLTNPLAALDNGNMIPAIFLAIFIAVAIRSSGKNVPLIHQAVHQINQVMQTMLGFILWLAPLVIFVLTTVTIAKLGADALYQILSYFLTVVGVLILHVTVTYTALLHFSKLNPWMFFKKMLAVKFFAFGTSSSNATIPINIKNAENRLGISQSISSFVIPLGSTVNMDGTAIMLAVVSIFGANLFNIELSLFEYFILLLSIIFYSVAIAGIPKGSLAVLSLILTTSVGLPLDQAVTIIGIVMVVDHLLDMLRTAVNVTGDAVIACVIARSENELNDKIFDDPNACCLIETNLLKPKKNKVNSNN